MNDNKGTLAKVEKVADDIRSAGGEAMAMRCDVRNREDIDSVVASTVKEFGQIDIHAGLCRLRRGQRSNSLSYPQCCPRMGSAQHPD